MPIKLTLKHCQTMEKKQDRQPEICYKDLPDQFNDFAGDAMKKRGKYFLNNMGVEVLVPKHGDIEVHRNDNFLLLTDGTEYKVIVEDLQWYVWKVKPQGLLSLAIENVLQKQKSKF